jgi:hypothetical protein
MLSQTCTVIIKPTGSFLRLSAFHTLLISNLQTG